MLMSSWPRLRGSRLLLDLRAWAPPLLTTSDPYKSTSLFRNTQTSSTDRDPTAAAAGRQRQCQCRQQTTLVVSWRQQLMTSPSLNCCVAAMLSRHRRRLPRPTVSRSRDNRCPPPISSYGGPEVPTFLKSSLHHTDSWHYNHSKPLRTIRLLQ